MKTPKEITLDEMIKRFDEKYPNANIKFVIDPRINTKVVKEYQGINNIV